MSPLSARQSARSARRSGPSVALGLLVALGCLVALVPLASEAAIALTTTSTPYAGGTTPATGHKPSMVSSETDNWLQTSCLTNPTSTACQAGTAEVLVGVCLEQVASAALPGLAGLHAPHELLQGVMELALAQAANDTAFTTFFPRMRLLLEDCGSSANSTVEGVERLVARAAAQGNMLVGLIGGNCHECAIGLARAGAQLGLPIVSPAATLSLAAPAAGSAHVFLRTAPTDRQQIEALYDVAATLVSTDAQQSELQDMLGFNMARVSVALNGSYAGVVRRKVAEGQPQPALPLCLTLATTDDAYGRAVLADALDVARLLGMTLEQHVLLPPTQTVAETQRAIGDMRAGCDAAYYAAEAVTATRPVLTLLFSNGVRAVSHRLLDAARALNDSARTLLANDFLLRDVLSTPASDALGDMGGWAAQLGLVGALPDCGGSGMLQRTEAFEAAYLKAKGVLFWDDGTPAPSATPATSSTLDAFWALAAWDSVQIYARALRALAIEVGSVSSTGSLASYVGKEPWRDGAKLAAALQAVSFLGASGPVAFTASGARKNVRLRFVQLQAPATPTPGVSVVAPVVGHWSTLFGAELDQPAVVQQLPSSAALYHKAQTLLVPVEDGEEGERAFVGLPRVASSYAGFAQWQSVPAQGLQPSSRYGACTVVSEEADMMYVLYGTANTADLPRQDVWEYSFVTQSWRSRRTTNPRPTPRYYTQCVLTNDFIVLVGGFGKEGLLGDAWKLRISTNEWTELQLPLSISGRSQRAQFGMAASPTGLVLVGGGHGRSSDSSIWSLDIETDIWSVANPRWNGPAEDNQLPTLGLRVGPILARMRFNGHDAYVLTGGYLANMTNSLLYEPALDQVSPFPCRFSSEEDRIELAHRSIVNGVTVPTLRADGSKSLKLYIQKGWEQYPYDPTAAEQSAGANYNSVFSLDLNCPGVDCGLWKNEGAYTDNRDSFNSMAVGEALVSFGGWGESSVHNDFNVFSTRTGTNMLMHEDALSPPSRWRHTACRVSSSMLVFGGLSAGGVLSDLWGFNLDMFTWTSIQPPLPTPLGRYGHSATAIQMDMWMFGGTAADGTLLIDLWKLSLSRKTWTQYSASSTTATWPVGRAFHGAFVWRQRAQRAQREQQAGELQTDEADGFLVVYGGTGIYSSFLSDMHVWYPANNTWQALMPNLPDSNLLNDQGTADEGDLAALLAAAAARPATPASAEHLSVAALQALEATSSVSQAAIVMVEPYLFVLGGWDSGLNPLATVLMLNMDAMEARLGMSEDDIAARSVVWKKMHDMPKPLNSHAAVAYDGKIYVYGGLTYEIVQSSLLRYDLASDLWIDLNPVASQSSWTVPRGIVATSVVLHGNRLFFFGGASVAFSDVFTPDYTLSEHWSYVVGPSCRSDSDVEHDSETASGVVPACVHCSQGTVPLFDGCKSCPNGSYWVQAASGSPSGTCRACEAGTVGSFSGATTPALCLPCGFNTFAPAVGLSECVACEANALCPLRSSTQITQAEYNEAVAAQRISAPDLVGQSFEQVRALYLSRSNLALVPTWTQTQPVPYVSRSSEVSRRTSELTWALLAVACALAAVYIVFVLSEWGSSWSLPHFSEKSSLHFLSGATLAQLFKYTDRLYAANHLQVVHFPMTMRRTSMGGWCAFVTLAVGLWLIATLSLPYSLDNSIERRTLVPDVGLYRQRFVGDIVASVELAGYDGECIKPDGSCVDRLTASWGSYKGGVTTCARTPDKSLRALSRGGNPTSCRMTLRLDGAELAAANATGLVQFAFAEPNAYATSINWQWSSSTGIPEDEAEDLAVAPQVVSTLQGTIMCDVKSFIRGLSQPSTVSALVTRTLFEDLPSSITNTGYHNSYTAAQLGETIGSESFHDVNGVAFQFQLSVSVTSLSIQRDNKQTLIQYLNALIAGLAGVMSALAIVLFMAEMLEDFWYQWQDMRGCGRRKGADAKEGSAERAAAEAEAESGKPAREKRALLGTTSQLRALHVSMLGEEKVAAIEDQTLNAGRGSAAIQPNGMPTPKASGLQRRNVYRSEDDAHAHAAEQGELRGVQVEMHALPAAPSQASSPEVGQRHVAVAPQRASNAFVSAAVQPLLANVHVGAKANGSGSAVAAGASPSPAPPSMSSAAAGAYSPADRVLASPSAVEDQAELRAMQIPSPVAEEGGAANATRAPGSAESPEAASPAFHED